MNKEFNQLEIKQDWLEWTKNDADFRPLDSQGKPLNQFVSVFHSGGIGKNFEKAEGLSNSLLEQGYTTLEQTKDGKLLHQKDLWQYGDKSGLTRNDVKEIWEAASEKFAHQASGKVYAFVDGARDDGVFKQTELKILLENEKVTHINEIPRQELLHHYKFSADKQAALHDIHKEVSQGIKALPDYSTTVKDVAFERAKELLLIEPQDLAKGAAKVLMNRHPLGIGINIAQEVGGIIADVYDQVINAKPPLPHKDVSRDTDKAVPTPSKETNSKGIDHER